MRKSVMTMGIVLLACASLWGCKGGNSNNSRVATASNIEDKSLESVRHIISRAYANSLYGRLDLDESLNLAILFDTNGKAYVEGDYVNGFYISKDKSLVASYDSSSKPYWEVLNEYTPLYCVEKALDLVYENKGSISTYDGEEGDTVYQIDIKGSNIKEFFDDLGKQVSDEYCKFLFGKDSLNLTDLDMVNIYVMNNKDNLPIFKMDVQTSSDGIKTVWNLTGLFEAGAVTFDDSVSNIKNGDDFEAVSKILDNEKEKIGKVLAVYVENHPEIKEKLDLKSIDTSEIGETSSSETTISDETTVSDETASLKN